MICQTIDMKDFGHYVRLARKRAGGMSQDGLAAKSGLSKGTIQNIENGKTEGSATSLEKIAQAFGFDTMQDMVNALAREEDGYVGEDERDGIPVFDEVPAGNGDFDPTDVGEDNGFAHKRVSRWMCSDPQAYAVIVKGNSMEPDYYSGDVVICSPSEPHTSPMLAVFRLRDGSCGLKIVEAVGEDELLLIPRNPNHTTRRVKRSDVVRLAHVVGSFRRRQIPMNV